MIFRAVVESSGRTATGINVPEHVVAALGQGKRPPVTVTIGAYTYRTTIGVMGGRYMLPLSAAHRAGAGVAAGDEIDVDLVLDTQPREVSVPADFAAALARDERAKAIFDELPHSHRRRWVESVTSAKAEQTRQRRIDKAIAELGQR